MGLTRRQFGMITSAVLLGGRQASAAMSESAPTSLILAPSNLGLRPEDGKEPGTWRAPQNRSPLSPRRQAPEPYDAPMWANETS